MKRKTNAIERYTVQKRSTLVCRKTIPGRNVKGTGASLKLDKHRSIVLPVNNRRCKPLNRMFKVGVVTSAFSRCASLQWIFIRCFKTDLYDSRSAYSSGFELHSAFVRNIEVHSVPVNPRTLHQTLPRQPWHYLRLLRSPPEWICLSNVTYTSNLPKMQGPKTWNLALEVGVGIHMSSPFTQTNFIGHFGTTVKHSGVLQVCIWFISTCG